MLRLRILSFLLFAFMGSAIQAQDSQPSAAPPPVILREDKPPTDIVAAVQKLFLQRQAGGWRHIRLTSLTLVSPAVALLVLEANPIGIVVVGAAVGVGIGKLVRFSSKKEAAVIQAYQSGQPLPPTIRKRLRNKHFR